MAGKYVLMSYFVKCLSDIYDNRSRDEIKHYAYSLCNDRTSAIDLEEQNP